MVDGTHKSEFNLLEETIGHKYLMILAMLSAVDRDTFSPFILTIQSSVFSPLLSAVDPGSTRQTLTGLRPVNEKP